MLPDVYELPFFRQFQTKFWFFELCFCMKVALET